MAAFLPFREDDIKTIYRRRKSINKKTAGTILPE